MNLLILAEFTLGSGLVFGIWQLLSVSNWEAASSGLND